MKTAKHALVLSPFKKMQSSSSLILNKTGVWCNDMCALCSLYLKSLEICVAYANLYIAQCKTIQCKHGQKTCLTMNFHLSICEWEISNEWECDNCCAMCIPLVVFVPFIYLGKVYIWRVYSMFNVVILTTKATRAKCKKRNGECS